MIGTPIATKIGWRPVEALCLGDMVLTFDHGFREIVGMRRIVLWDGRGACPASLRPLCIDAGLLENKLPVNVLPDQGIMVESDTAENYRGDPFAVLYPRGIKAYSLAESEHVDGSIEVVVLEFADDEVIYGKDGLHYFMPKAFDLFSENEDREVYKTLNEDEVVKVLDELFEAILER